MESSELKIIGNEISAGHFDNYKEVLIKLGKTLSQKQALYLIACCCSTCNASINEPEKLNEQDVMILFKNCSKIVTTVSSEECDSYLQSIFYICKLLLKKDYKLLLELEDEIIPLFIPDTLTAKQRGIYGALCELIRVELINNPSTNQEVDKNTLISIGSLLSKILIKSGNQKFLCEVIQTYGSYLLSSKVDLILQYNYFMFNCDQLKSISADIISCKFSNFISYGINLFSLNLRNGTLQDADQIITKLVFITPEIKDWQNFKEILYLCRHLINSNIKVEDLKSYKNSFIVSAKLYKKNDNFHNLCKMLSFAINSFSYFCKNHDTKKKFCNPKVHTCVYEIIDEIMDFFINLCDKKFKNVREVSELAISTVNLFNTLLLNTNVPQEFTISVMSSIEKYCKFLVSLKGCYEKLDIVWSENAAHMYNLGVILLRNGYNISTLSISHMILKYHSLLGKLEDQLILPNTMGLLSSVYLKEKKYLDAFTWNSMQIIYTNEESKISVLHKLLKIKAAAKEDESSTLIQELTVCSVKQHIPSQYKCYIKKISSVQTQISLLINELEIYHQKWKSKIPMMSAFRQLCEIADNLTLMKVFINVFSDWETHVHDNVVILLQKIFVEFEETFNDSNKNREQRVFLLFIYYFRYKIQSIEIIAKNIQEMNKAETVQKSPEYPVDVMPADAYCQCDVISSYEGLNINGSKMRNLENALKELEELIAGDIMSLLENINPNKIQTLAMNLALEFHLHSDLYHSFKAFYLAFKIAFCMEDKILMLQCGGHLLRYLKDNKLEKQLEEEVSILRTNKENFKYLVQYYMHLSYLYLFENNVSTAVKHFETALEYLNDLNKENEKYHWRTDISMELLRFKLMHTLKMSKLSTEPKSSFRPLMKAHDLMVQKYSTELEWGPAAMVLFFDVLESMVKMYHDLKMPREVRCFGKQSLTLAQQHQIPMLSVKFLSYLAHADFRSERWCDCRVKLDGISEIMLLEKDKILSEFDSFETRAPTDEPVNSITEGIKEMELNEGDTENFNVKLGPSSPVLIGDSYKHPQFSDHKNCECFKCTSIEYQQLAVSRYHLEALWYTYKKQITLARSFFRGTSEFYQLLTVKEPVIPKNLPLNPYLSTNTQTNSVKRVSFNEYNYQCSIDYIKFLYSSGAHELAKKHCNSISNQLKVEKNIYPNLYGEVLLLKLGIISKTRLGEKTVSIKLLTPCKTDAIFKTPEKCISKTILEDKQRSVKIKLIPPKVIKFSLAEGEVDCKDKKTPSKVINKQYKTPSRTPKSIILPPSLRSTLTPLFKTPRKKTSLDEGNEIDRLHSTKTEIPNRMESNTKVSRGVHLKRHPLIEILEPSNCENNLISNSANELKTSVKDHCLNAKTKLLTAKIKKTINEIPISNDSCEEIHTVRRSSRRKRL